MMIHSMMRGTRSSWCDRRVARSIRCLYSLYSAEVKLTTPDVYFLYGVSDWKEIATNGHFYIEKTPYIKSLEKSGKYWRVGRPRGFGKTLFCDQLDYFYDKSVDQKEVSAYCIDC